MDTVTEGRAELAPEQVSVLVAGGGPVALTLALTLGQHDVAAILVERNPSTTAHPKMDITNGTAECGWLVTPRTRSCPPAATA